MAQASLEAVFTDSATWDDLIRDIYLEGCCKILRLDLELRTSSTRAISARVSHFRSRAARKDSGIIAGMLCPELESLHLLHANFDHRWSGVAQQDFAENDACRYTMWRTMQQTQPQKAQDAALKLLQRQLRSECTQTLTEILYSAVARVTLSCEAETPALQHLYRLLSQENRAALLGFIKQGRSID